jgi:hypothetical protein
LTRKETVTNLQLGVGMHCASLNRLAMGTTEMFTKKIKCANLAVISHVIIVNYPIKVLSRFSFPFGISFLNIG